jgi:phytanoyl-CoA hydroxylase
MMEKALAKEYIDHFNKNGFFILQNYISEVDIKLIHSQIAIALDTTLKNIGRDDLISKSNDEKYLFLAKEHPILKSHVYDILGRLDSVQRLFSQSQLLDLGQALLQSPLAIDYIQIRIDDNSRDLPLHQEMGQLSTKNMTVWIPLVDIDGTCGGLNIVPGSHTRGRVPHRYYPEMSNYHGICENHYTQEELTPVQLKQGSAVCFHPHLFHGTSPNPSNRIRWTMVGRLNDLTELGYLKDAEAPLHMPQHIDIDEG